MAIMRGIRCGLAIAGLMACSVCAAGDNTFIGAAGGDWHEVANWSLGTVPTADDDVVISSGSVVATNAIVAGSIAMTDATLTLGTEPKTANDRTRPHISANIAGDLTMSGASKLYVYAGELTDYAVFADDATAIAACAAAANVVTVGGAFTVDGTSVVYPQAAHLTGVPVFFKVAGNVSVAEGASFDTRVRGWGWSSDLWADHPANAKQLKKEGASTVGWTVAIGACPGYMSEANYGATRSGYEWTGSDYTSVYSKNYGYSFAPFMPGSPGGNYYACNVPGTTPYETYDPEFQKQRGSGSIVILSQGDMTVDGQMLADGTLDKVIGNSSPSGGGIWLAAQSFTFGANAKLLAEGGKWGDGVFRPGHGGRIALAEGCTDEELTTMMGGTLPASVTESPTIEGVTVSVLGGDKNGTRVASGTLSTVRSKNVSTTLTTQQLTGENLVASGITWGDVILVKGEYTYEAPEYAYLASDAGVRYRCAGYVVSNATSAVASGEGRTATFTLVAKDGPYTLTWLWDAREVKVSGVISGEGSITVGGTTYTSAFEQWFASGEAVTCAPVDATYFAYWAGTAVPGGYSQNQTIEIAPTASATLVAGFANETVSRRWVGGKGASWFAAGSWEPAGIPTSLDDVYMTNATVTIDTPLVLKSLTLSGTALTLGNATSRPTVSASITGDLTLAGASSFTVYAAELADLGVFADRTTAQNAIAAAATRVTIGGAFTVDGTSVVYPDAAPISGVPVLFTCDTFTLGEGAKFDATGRGWHWWKGAYETLPAGAHARTRGSYTGAAVDKDGYTYAFGCGLSYGISGAGYGGQAQNGGCEYQGQTYGMPYGFDFAPFLPGSPAGWYCDSDEARGSGSVVVWAAGEATIDGTITASAMRCNDTPKGNGDHGGASGGGIWIAASSVSFGTNAYLSAMGGNTLNNAYPTAGGGGRITLSKGLEMEELETCLTTGTLPEGLKAVDGIEGVTCSVAHGYMPNGNYGTAADGTVKTVFSLASTTTLNVQSSVPDLVAEGVSWGEVAMASGTYSFTAPVYAYLATDAGVRYSCAGYVVSNKTSQIAAGDGRTVSFTITTKEGPYTLTWLWDTREVLLTGSIGGTGAITVDGVMHDTDFEQWLTSSKTVACEPVDATYFSCWTGSAVPGSYTTAKKITIALTASKAITASFASETVSRRWVGGNGASWFSPDSWEPSGIPTPLDDVYLTNATLAVDAAFAVKSMTIAGASAVTFQADGWEAESTASNLYANAMVIAISDRFEISGTSVVTAANDAKSGKPVKFTAGSVVLGADATITASEKGWAWFKGTDPYQRFAQGDETAGFYWTRAMGPGGGTTAANAYNRGAGHGAKGGNAGDGFGAEYGYKYAPFLPGSPNGMYQWSEGNTGPGGGTVWIVSSGLFELNGTITAKGQYRAFGTPSGGGVWLAAPGFKIGALGSISAEGGDMDKNYSYGSRGAGGRVSLAIGLSQAQLDYLAAGGDPADYPAGDLSAVDTIEVVSVSVRGCYDVKGNAYGSAGTMTTVTGPYGLKTVNVLSSGPLAQGVSPAYGANAFEDGSVQRFTAPEYGTDPSSELIRYKCLGYIVSNATELVAAGEGRSVDVTIANAPMSVTWQWAAAENAIAVRKPEHGTLTLGGETLEGDAIQWVTGTMAPVGIVPDAGYAFVCWRGNTPVGQATVNPLQIAAEEPVDVTPVLREDVSPTTRTWCVVSGVWYEPANWDPAGVPSADDTLVLASGTCTVGNYLGAAALTISGGTLQVMATGDTCGELAISGDMAISGGSVTIGRAKTQTKRARLAVGGNLTLANAATLQVYGAPITATDTFATGTSDITVGGTFAVNGTASVRLFSDYYTGGSVKITADAFTLAEGATVDAHEAGYMWLDNDTQPDSLGTGYSYTIGAGYGNTVTNADATHGHAYGFANAPVHPGSPSGVYKDPSRGGGLVRIHARSMSVYGTIDANAYMKSQFGGGSGGGIWLTADAFTFGTTAKLLARGGPSGLNSSQYYYSCGSGGRIAIGLKLDAERIEQLARTGTWTGARRRQIKDEAAFRNAIGNDDMTIMFDSYLTYPEGDENTPGTFVFVDGVDMGTILLIK